MKNFATRAMAYPQTSKAAGQTTGAEGEGAECSNGWAVRALPIGADFDKHDARLIITVIVQPTISRAGFAIPLCKFQLASEMEK